ncbi:MAG TPA: YqaJ viral recombinase family protein [Verrucomicrobiae bacterium]|nr:YqaJ viral recombinase family protein [Verrucomicrobiae bacterium]
MITWHDVIQGSPAWKLLRKGLWTGSTAIRLLQGKQLLPDSDWSGNDATRRGHALEVAAIREYERKYRVKVQRPGFVTNSVYPNAGYSPDGIDRAWLLECKALIEMRHKGLISDKMPLSDLQGIIASKIPLQYKVQIFFGMIITGKRKARLLAFNPDIVDQEQLIVVEIGYDRLIGDNIRRKLRLDMKKRQSVTTDALA